MLPPVAAWSTSEIVEEKLWKKDKEEEEQLTVVVCKRSLEMQIPVKEEKLCKEPATVVCIYL